MRFRDRSRRVTYADVLTGRIDLSRLAEEHDGYIGVQWRDRDPQTAPPFDSVSRPPVTLADFTPREEKKT